MIDKSDERQDSGEGTGKAAVKRVRQTVKKAAPFSAGVLAALAAILLYSVIFPPARPLTDSQLKQVIDQTMASATPPPPFSASVYATIRPSLVLIESHSAQEDSLGSGVVVDDAGDILTCLHVIQGSEAIRVTFADGTTAVGSVIATQPENDIAVLSADRLPKKLVPAVLGNPGAMHVGDDAFVVGNPFGLYSSMSAGVISGFNRSFQPPEKKKPLDGLIQIDAAVNPGNSGGPLLNRSGEVVGIVTGIVNPTEQNVFIGIGFAVPIDVAGGAMGAPPY
jgi:S1-C subfamily serine protease